ncbi:MULTISPECIES: MFS transporter [unclassified Rhizobacter]|uniref:MFS transporter n=1 Tax=unclassified Rhizobacter TaxID=2640088 RepID=UPI0006FE87AB|nr:MULTISPECIES: MFS transporter [unclassified Rhizobacter]KQU75661.1 MFS transporter [Rhizobacter sp. Root29]KQW07398.1 MFS transporter [Rhizobacter sp. Root1238]KRB18053.1 MFS transporter [Rhizobacter sp. Root16D2]
MSAAPAPTAVAVPVFTGYQKVVLGLLAFLQFAVILDFMLMAPLGALIMPALSITPKQFGLVVSAYAFSAGTAGLLTAGFADRFDRKKLLLFFYGGFVLGTLWCGLAPTFESLLAARIVTGLFGGVIGSIVLAISTDLFPASMRGRVMGVIQTAFAASQVLGLPAGLYLSNHWDWHMPFFAMAALGLVGGVVVAWRLQPVDGHLKLPQERGAFAHLLHTVAVPRHLLAFAATALLTTGGFMLMPFSSAFTVNNLGIDLHSLPVVYLVTGLCTIVFGPLIGRAADRFGKFRMFTVGTLLAMTMVQIYTHLGPVPLPVLIAVNAVLFVGIFSRMIPFQAMVAGVPSPAQRGAFNAISSSVQQLSGGIASVVAGHIVTAGADGRLQHFDWVGHVVVAASVASFLLVWRLQRADKPVAVAG